jgi:hypothetical protein
MIGQLKYEKISNDLNCPYADTQWENAYRQK